MEPIVPLDVGRMFLGDAPGLFYLEIAVRVAIIWVWTIFMLRWVGGRSIAQMSVVEFLLVIALGSAVGDPMFQADVPLLHAMLVILLVVLADKAIDFAFRHFSKAKRLVDGPPTEVLHHGHLTRGGLDARGIGAAEVMEMLRLQGVRNLGEVEHAFMEPSGELSVFRWSEARPGLRIVPPLELRHLSAPDGRAAVCCTTCGLVQQDPATVCAECGGANWTSAERQEAAPDP